MDKDKYTSQDKNQLFTKIQDYVQSQKLTRQNMVDLHDILTTDKPSYSHNKNGTMYMSTKYSDETFEKIEELLNWVDKQYSSESGGPQNTDKITMEKQFDESSNPDADGNSQSNDESQLQDAFGKDKRFKNTFGAGRFKMQKPTDVTKSNEVYKRIIKKSKKRSSIPIHHQEKELTSWEDCFNHKRNCHFSEFYMSRNIEDDEEDEQDEEELEDYIDSDEEEEEEEEEDEALLYEQFGEDEDELEDDELEEGSIDLEDDELEDELSE